MIRARSVATLIALIAGIGFAADSPPYPAPIDGPFRSVFGDATILKVEPKERRNLFAVSSSIGSGKYTNYELTFTDALNKKVTAEYSAYGDLLYSDTFKKSFERLPAFLQTAIVEHHGAVAPDTVLEIKAKYDSPDHCKFKISGRDAGKKIDLEVLNRKRVIPPEAKILALHQTVNVFHDGDKPTEKNTVDLSGSMSTPYSAKFKYRWEQISGDDLKLSPEALAKPELKLPIRKAGSYSFQLTVTDENGLSASAEKVIQAVETVAEVLDETGK